MNAEKGNKAGERAGHMSCEERLSTPGLSSLEQRRPRGDPRALCNSLRSGGAGLCPWSPMSGFMGMAQSCQLVRLDGRKNVFVTRVVKRWNRLQREVVDASWLSAFKRHLDHALNNML